LVIILNFARSIDIDEISQILGSLRYHIEHQNSISHTDINFDMEKYLIPLLIDIYDFTNLEKLPKGTSDIDLGDKTNKVAIQITSEKRRTKIQDTINGFIKNHLNKPYTTLYVFILGKKASYKGSFDTQGLITFTKENILDFDILFQDLKDKKDIDIQKKIYEYLKKQKICIPIRQDFTSFDLRDVIQEFAKQNPELIRNIIPTFENSIPIEDKNQKNNLSKDYFEYIKQNSQEYFKQILHFLIDFKNQEFRDLYYNIVSDLQKFILINRTDYERFDDLFEIIEEQLTEKSELLAKKRFLLRLFLHFMYFNCDIGIK